MAKKKNETASASSAKKSPAKSAPTGAASIDTNLAANAAAAMVANKVAQPAPASAAPKKESAAFKQLKAGLNKPSAGALGGAFAAPSQKKKSNLPFGGGKQVGRNQTFGADVTRSGVPRRTAG